MLLEKLTIRVRSPFIFGSTSIRKFTFDVTKRQTLIGGEQFSLEFYLSYGSISTGVKACPMTTWFFLK